MRGGQPFREDALGPEDRLFERRDLLGELAAEERHDQALRGDELPGVRPEGLLEVPPHPGGQAVGHRHVAREIDRDRRGVEIVDELAQVRLDPFGLVGDDFVVEARLLDRVDVVRRRDGRLAKDAALAGEQEGPARDDLVVPQNLQEGIDGVFPREGQPGLDLAVGP